MTNTVTFLNTSEQQIYGETGLVIMWVIEKKKYILMDCVQTIYLRVPLGSALQVILFALTFA